MKLSIQFHAIEAEIAEIVAQIQKMEGVSMYILRPELVAVDRDADARKLVESSKNLIAYFGKIKCTTSNMHKLAYENPGILFIDIGKHKGNEIMESMISSISQDPEVIKLWKKVMLYVKKNTKSGLIAMDKRTGEKHYYADMRYTKGAADAWLRGERLIVYGDAEIQIPKEK